MDLIFGSADEISPTENHIKQIHSVLLQHVAKDAPHRGKYKTLPNNVAAFDADGREIGVVFETATPFDTPRLMEKLVAWFNDSDGKLHPLIRTAVFIVCLLAIHPFQDGNGRVSRVLTTLLMLRAGYAYVPYSSLESVIEANKEAYCIALGRTQSTLRGSSTEWNPWLMFFANCLRRQIDNLSRKLDREGVFAQKLCHRLPERSSVWSGSTVALESRTSSGLPQRIGTPSRSGSGSWSLPGLLRNPTAPGQASFR